MNASERADAILATMRKANIPHPHDPGMRIVGWVVPEELAGLSDALFALDQIVVRSSGREAALQEGGAIIKAYDAAMACQGEHAHDAKLIVMANYGDLALGILRALISGPAAQNIHQRGEAST